MHPLSSKSARTGLWYIAFCALAYFGSHRFLAGLCSDERHAVVREFLRGSGDAEVLFLGSSQTARGVMPKVFDARASELAGRAVRSLNLSTEGNPRHIAYSTLSKWLDGHAAPRAVFVECGVLSDLPEYPHETLTRFIDASDALSGLVTRPYTSRDKVQAARRAKETPLFDPFGFFRAMDRRALHVELALDALGRGPEDLVRAGFNWTRNPDGRPYWKPGAPNFQHIVDSQVLELGFYRIDPASELGLGGRERIAQQAARVSYEDAVAAQWTGDDEFADASRFTVSRVYAQAIAELCRARGIRLVFLDQPNFRGRPLRPSQVEFYRSLGELFIQDKSVLYREESFQDPGHLSLVGAEFASRALAEFYVTAR